MDRFDICGMYDNSFGNALGLYPGQSEKIRGVEIECDVLLGKAFN